MENCKPKNCSGIEIYKNVENTPFKKFPHWIAAFQALRAYQQAEVLFRNLKLPEHI